MVPVLRQGGAVAATSHRLSAMKYLAAIVVVVCCMMQSRAAVLPEDEAEIMYHLYDGGGVEVDGPALLVRKGLFDTMSVSVGYYRDSISGASPDVILGGSKYSDSRDELSAGIEYLYGNSLMNLGFASSDESDYEADTISLGVSHEVFGGLTTVSMGYVSGSDTVSRSDNASFGDDNLTEADIDRNQYQLGLSQVLTPTLIVSVNYEAITDDGFLNNPYRSVILQGGLVAERYPGTRTSQALALQAKKHWLNRSASHFGYRFFTDTWEIQAHTIDLGYTSYVGSRLLADIYYRFYDQSAASFYSNNFEQELNFMARDKELSSYTSNTLGVKFTYRLFEESKYGLHGGDLGFIYEYMKYDYDDYSGVTDISNFNASPYSFDASTLQLYFSVRY